MCKRSKIRFWPCLLIIFCSFIFSAIIEKKVYASDGFVTELLAGNKYTEYDITNDTKKM